ncbi:MAG: ABC transporter permease, partial [Anaerolineae bacterium]|nr:ABC transporter permease [Anaerolineae bacterium]
VMDVYLAREKGVSQPANITFKGDRLGRETVEAALREPGVAEAEIETLAAIRWRLPDEKEWRQGVLIAREGYASQQVSRVELLEGDWPTESILAVERQTARYFDVSSGAAIVVETGRGAMVSIGGVVRKPYVLPPQYNGPATFYATPETVARLTGVQGPNKLYVRLVPDGADLEGVRERVEERLVRMGLYVSGFTAAGVEDEFPADVLGDWLDALFLLLGVLGVASLGVSAFLIVNTIDAIVVRQVWQIGVMKALGSTFWRLARIYLATALIYGLLALGLAVPLGALGAHALSGWLLETFNVIATGDFQVSPVAIGVQAVVAVAVPLLAAVVPVVGGVRVSPHRAISTYGLGGRFGRGPLDRLMGRVRFLPRPMAISLRNVFRRKVRVALTLFTFVFVGVMFIAVLSARSSLENTVEMTLESFAYDVMVVMPRYYPVGRLTEVTADAPGVAKVEVWDAVEADLSLATGEKRELSIYGVPPDSYAFRPRFVAGRNLLPGDGRAILLNNRVAAERDVQVGDELTLTIAGQESTWTVVGLILDVTPGTGNFVPFDALALEAGHAGRGNTVIVISEAHDGSAQAQLVADLSDLYAAQHIETTTLRSAEEYRQMGSTMFDVITYLLLTMAFLAAVVGGIGLAGTLSINVVERMREIGVMRATGAASLDVFGIFIGEGVFLGVLSWVLAVPLSYPGARVLSDALGMVIANSSLEFEYSFPSVGIWLVIVTLLSALASVGPTWRATRVSVREVLAYE